MVGVMLIATADLGEGSDGGCFGYAHRFQREGTVQGFFLGWRTGLSHGESLVVFFVAGSKSK